MMTKAAQSQPSRGTGHRHRLRRRRYPASRYLEVLQLSLLIRVLLSNIDKLAQIFREQKIRAPCGVSSLTTIPQYEECLNPH